MKSEDKLAFSLVHKELSLLLYAGLGPDSGDFGSVCYRLDSASRIVTLGSALSNGSNVIPRRALPTLGRSGRLRSERSSRCFAPSGATQVALYQLYVSHSNKKQGIHSLPQKRCFGVGAPHLVEDTAYLLENCV